MNYDNMGASDLTVFTFCLSVLTNCDMNLTPCIELALTLQSNILFLL